MSDLKSTLLMEPPGICVEKECLHSAKQSLFEAEYLQSNLLEALESEYPVEFQYDHD